MLLNLTSGDRIHAVMWLFIISSSQMFANSSQESDLSTKNNSEESRQLSQGTQSYQKRDENYLHLPSNNDKDNNTSSGNSGIIRFLHPENRNSHASTKIESGRKEGLMWFTADNQKEKNSPRQGSSLPIHARKNNSDDILPTKTTNVKTSKLDKREAKINWKKDIFRRKSKDALAKIKPQRRQKPYKDVVRSGSTVSQEYDLKEDDMYHLEVPLQYQSAGENISLTDRKKMENKRLTKDDSSATTSQDSILGRIRRTLVSLFGGSKHSPSMEDVMKVDDAVVLSFPKSTLSTFLSSSNRINAHETNPCSPTQSLNNSHSLAADIFHEYPRTPPFVQDEPNSGNLLAFRTNPHTNLRYSHSIIRRSRDSESDERHKGYQFPSHEHTEDYNYDSLNYSNDNVQPKFSEFYDEEYDNEEFIGNKEESQSNPHSVKMESQSTPILLKITRESGNKNYDLFNGPNVNVSTNKNTDSIDYRSPRFVANLNDDSRKFSSSTRNHKSPKVLLYIRNDKPGTISHGSDMSSSTEEIVQQLYKHLLSLHGSTSLNEDITAQSSSYSPRSLKYNPQSTSPKKSATVSYKNNPFSGSYRTASGNTHSGPLTHNTQSSIDRSKKILRLFSQLSLIIEDEETRLKNTSTGTDSQNHLKYYKSQMPPRVIKHNHEPSSLDNSLRRKLDMRNANVKPEEKDRSFSFTLPIPVEYPQQREKLPDRSANLWRTSQEQKRGIGLTRRQMYDEDDFGQATLKGVQPYDNKHKYDKWGSLESYAHSQRSGYKPKTNHRDYIKSAEMYNHRRALSPYNKQKPDTIISKSSGDVSIKVRLPSDIYGNTYDDKVREPLRSNTESKYQHHSSPSLKRQSKPFDNQYSYNAKHDEQSSEEDDITASDLNFEDIFAVVKHGVRTVKFYWDMIKKGWPILLDDS
ncbi:uncharacterized protein [Anabrus simplex]|uniref:uncharacterized protein n=1 Tax=Anabrus simplex TaxID=316456 RepID=UPI0035A317C7